MICSIYLSNTTLTSIKNIYINKTKYYQVVIKFIYNIIKKMSKLNTSEDNTIKIIVNKGTGAGGSDTNYYGKKFEEKTNNEQRLLEMGYNKNSFTKNPKKTHDYYLSKTFDIWFNNSL